MPEYERIAAEWQPCQMQIGGLQIAEGFRVAQAASLLVGA
jgi:hypothetical protein